MFSIILYDYFDYGSIFDYAENNILQTTQNWSASHLFILLRFILCIAEFIAMEWKHTYSALWMTIVYGIVSFRFFTSKLRPSNRFLLLNYMLPLSLSVFRFSYHLLEAFPCEIIEDVLRQQWESTAIQGNLPTLHKQSSISCNSHYSQKGKFHRVSKIVQIDRQLFSNVYLFVLSLISFQCDSMIYMNALSPDSEKLIWNFLISAYITANLLFRSRRNSAIFACGRWINVGKN